MPIAPDAMLGPYRITGLLGEGGMGTVYRAKDTRLGRDVAVKILTNVTLSDRERLLRFEQEARTTGMLNHPNLLTVYDVGNAEGTPFLVTELLEGETLSSRLGRGPLSTRRALDAALQMAQGLAAAHDKNVVHRDLKPDNIFLTRDGRVKILDFGIAKLTGNGDAPFATTATEPGMVLGTVGYMAPEQVRGEAVDARCDIFAFGAILFEMLTGRRAFKRDSSIETLSAILKEDPPDVTELLPNAPPAVEKLLRRCLDKDRSQRFQSARDLAFTLESLATMSTGASMAGTSAGVSRPAPAAVPNALAPTLKQQSAAPTVRTTAHRQQPKPRVSPLLLGLFWLVTLAGAAYAGLAWANRNKVVAGEVSYQRMTFRRGEVRGARFTPDGATIVYSAAWDGQPSEVFIASGQAPEARPLGVPDAEVLAVSRGEIALLLRRDRLTSLGTLARIPLAGGMPREVANDVLQADWSPDGASLAIIRQTKGKYRLEYPIGNVRYETPHYIRDVRISPDGARVAFLEPLRGEHHLVLIEGNAKPVPIASGWTRGATGLAWSPDGKELWVTGTSTAAPPALFAVTLDGEQRLVTRLTGSTKLFDVSAAGRVLLSNGMWRAALAWGQLQPATVDHPMPTDFNERDASWLDWSILAALSPDGKTILFNETREGGGARSSIYLRHADAPAPVRIGDGYGDALSPDGKWVLAHHGAKLVLLPTGPGEPRELKLEGAFDQGALFLPDSRRAIVGGVVGNGGYQLHVLDTLDEKTQPLTPGGIWNGAPRAFAVSPDGTRVAGMTAEETIALYSIDGTPATPVNGAEKGEIPIVWSADGNALFVHRPTALPAQVYRIDLTTGTRELWKEFRPADPAGVYRLAPVLITPDARAYAYNALRTLSDLYVAQGLR
ncbi:MAG TPA: protein kinase [Thermoanaerobaculia bacterium]